MADTPMATMALFKLGSRRADSAIAKIRKGTASMASVKRDITLSVLPPT
jgi:hypothetical protein